MHEATITVPNQPIFAGCAAAFASKLAQRAGFGEQDREAIETAVDEACSFVIQRSQDESLPFSVSTAITPRGLVVKVWDQAPPIDPDNPGEEESTQISVQLMRALVDEVRFFNLGKAGNEIRLVKRFEGRIYGLIHQLAPQRSAVPDEITVREIEPEEAVGVSRCIYRAYGYTYSGEESIYSPEWVKQMTSQGDLVSVVAILPNTDVVGHGALIRLEQSGLYELGMAAVAPEYRGMGLFASITSLLIKQADHHRIPGLISQPVCHHPYSQRALLRVGFTECGLNLACLPSDEKVKGLADEPERGSLMDAIKVQAPQPKRSVYCPLHYRPMLDGLLAELGLSREVSEASGGGLPSRIDYQVYPAMARAVISVTGLPDETLEETIRHLLAGGTMVLWAELELGDPAAPKLVEYLNDNGFFFASVVLGPQKDFLRLQYLSHLKLTPERIKTTSEWGATLKSFVLEDYHKLAVHRL